MIKLTKFYARSFDLDALTIFWEIEDISLTDDIYAYEFTLCKSESATGPFDVVYGPFQNIFTFRDSIHPENHKNRTIYYVLQVKDKRTLEVEEWGPTAQLPEPNLEALEMIRQEDVLFRGYVGRKWYLFPRKTFGARCVCYNMSLQRQELGNCATCFATGYLGGFNNPIMFYGQKDPNGRQLQLGVSINQTPNVAMLRTISYPPIGPGDILVDSENHRWVAISVDVTQRLGYDIHQNITIKELLRGSVEYLLPVLDSIKNIEGISDRRNFTNPQSLNGLEEKPYYVNGPDGITY